MELLRSRQTAVDLRPDWPHVGSSSQTDFYWTHSGVLIAVPHQDAIDDGASSAENAAFQRGWALENGPFGLLIMIDRLAAQDRDARNCYGEVGSDILTGVALVGDTLLSRAIASFFMGMSNPQVAYRMFGEMAVAIAWLEEMTK